MTVGVVADEQSFYQSDLASGYGGPSLLLPDTVITSLNITPMAPNSATNGDLFGLTLAKSAASTGFDMR